MSVQGVRGAGSPVLQGEELATTVSSAHDTDAGGRRLISYPAAVSPGLSGRDGQDSLSSGLEGNQDRLVETGCNRTSTAPER